MSTRYGGRVDRDRQEVWFPGLAGVCDRGLRRARNEDAMALTTLVGAAGAVLVVCDGVSASEQAALASRTAAEVTLNALAASSACDSADAEQAMRRAAEEAQRAVAAIPHRRTGVKDPPSSTLVAAVVRDGVATIGWLGDSRAYFVSRSGTWLLSRDHTWPEPGVQALTRWLGASADGGHPVSVRSFRIPGAGHLVLCSDGLWNYAPTAADLGRLVAGLPDATPLGMARGLADFARATGGHDNITVVVAAVDAAGEQGR